MLAPGKDPSRAAAFVFVQDAAGDHAEAAATGGAVTVSSTSAWGMGCGWAPSGYPGPGPGPPNYVLCQSSTDKVAGGESVNQNYTLYIMLLIDA